MKKKCKLFLDKKKAFHTPLTKSKKLVYLHLSLLFTERNLAIIINIVRAFCYSFPWMWGYWCVRDHTNSSCWWGRM